MKCPRCRMAVDADEVQCSVCGEMLKARPSKNRLNTEGADNIETKEPYRDRGTSGPRLELTPGIIRIGVSWMICCVVFSLVAIGFAFYEYSIEAMWASFIAAALAGLPILYIILGRTVEAAYWYRKELMVLSGIAGGIFCVYLLGQAIIKSNVHVETAGMQEMVTNENFTKTLITAIICVSVILVMIPVARMLLKSSTMKTFTNRYETDSHQDMNIRASDNATSLELRRLELAHEAEMQRLELERHRIQIEADRVNLLTHESKLMLTAQTNESSNPSPNAGPSPTGQSYPPPPPPAPASYPPPPAHS